MRDLQAHALAVLTVVLTAGAIGSPSAAAETVWLCKPGLAGNPCKGSLETTVFTPEGDSRVTHPRNARRPKVDCFYVYPTVSEQLSVNADKTVDPAQRAIARHQAARFSKRCRVYAPMYRQVTILGLQSPPEQQAEALRLAYSDVLEAWKDYLRNYNQGRGFVLISHSQGTRMLRNLVRTEIDPRPRLRERMVSALLLGGNVTVAKRRGAGGDFEHVRACRRRTQTGCVVAFSTFNETPPDGSRYGRVGGGDSGNPFGFPRGPGYEVLCTNPASLARNRNRPLSTFLRSEPFPGVIGALLLVMYGGPPPSAETPWIQPQDHYTGECVTDNGANALMISPVGGARTLNASPEPGWGLHLADVNIALGHLLRVVRRQTRAYLG